MRQASDIVDVVSSYVAIKRAGRDFKALCPFHNEKTPSFHVVPSKQIYKCFGCGAGGDVFKFIQQKEGVGFPEALELLARRAGIDLAPERSRGSSAEFGPNELDRVNRWAARWFARQLSEPQGETGRTYVARRCIDPAVAEKFGLGLAPDSWETMVAAARAAGISDRLLTAAGLAKPRQDGSLYAAFRNRLMFPIRDTLGRVIGFGGRTLGDDPAKYLNSPQSAIFDKSRCLFGLDLAREAMAQSRQAVVVEGYLDCLLAHQFGFANVVATLGTALTPEHARLLQRYADKVIVVFDSDEAGRKAAERSLAELFVGDPGRQYAPRHQAIPSIVGMGLDVNLAHVPEGKDPADLLVSQGPDAFAAVLTSACEALEFQWNQVSGRYRDAKSGPERRRAIEDFMSLLVKSPQIGFSDPIQRGLILNQVGRLLGLSSEEAYRIWRSAARKAGASPAGRVKAAGALGIGADEATAAMRDLMSVLLNEPRHFALVVDEFDPDRCRDDRLKKIARMLVDTLRDDEEFSIARFISRFDDPAMSGLITDLCLAGERRGNHEATVEGALKCLRRIRQHAVFDRVVAAARQETRREQAPTDGARTTDESTMPEAAGDPGTPGSAARQLVDLVRSSGHFAARRHLAVPRMGDAGAS